MIGLMEDAPTWQVAVIFGGGLAFLAMIAYGFSFDVRRWYQDRNGCGTIVTVAPERFASCKLRRGHTGPHHGNGHTWAQRQGVRA